MTLSTASICAVKCAIVAAATPVAMLSPRPLPMRFFHSARLLTIAGAHGLEFAQPPHRRGRRCPWSRLEQSGVFADQNGIDFVSFVAAQFGAGEVTDLGRVDNADDVAGVVRRQRHAEAVTTGRLHADVGLLAAHGREPSQHQLPAIGAVLEGPALLSLTSCAVRVQALLGHVDSNYRVTHFLLPFQGLNTARLRVGLPCTRDQRQAASLDTVQHEQRSSEKRGHIYRTGSLTEGTHEAHRFPCCSTRYCPRRTSRNVQGMVITDRPPGRRGW